MPLVHNNLIVALFIISNFISWFIPISKPLVIIVILLELAYFYSNSFLLKKRALLYILLIFLLFAKSYLQNSNPYIGEKLIFFVVIGVFPFFIRRIDFKSVFFYISWVGVFLAIPFYLLPIGTPDDIDYWGSLMGKSYGILPIILASIYILLYKKTSKVFKAALLFSLLIYLNFVIQYGSRGLFLGLLLFTGFVLVFKSDSIFRLKKVYISITFLVLLPLVNEQSLIWLLESVVSLLGVFDVDVYAINKTVMYLSEGNVSNGRSDIYTLALADINSDNILWGLGVGSFQYIHRLNYIHNVFIQYLHEGGILYLIINCYIIIKFLINLVLASSKDSFFIGLFLLLVGLFPLLTSMDYWGHQPYWLFLAYIINDKIK